MPGVDTFCAHVDPRILVVRRGKPRKVRCLWRVPCSPPSSFGVHNSSVDNVCRAATERVLNEEVNGIWVPVARPEIRTFDRNLEDFAALYDSYATPTTPVTYTEMCEMYRGRKRMIYELARDSLSRSDVRPTDAFLKTFVKAEKICFATKSDPAPRLIQPRSTRYNMAVGVFLKPHEHVVYENLNKLFKARTVMKGLNAAEQGAAIREAWEAVTDPVAVDLDASRWDRHVSDVALHWEHDRYLKYFHGSNHDRLKMLLAWQYSNHCRAFLPDGFVKWSMRGGRASGDMNTAVGNVLLMCGLVYSWCAHAGITGYRLINNGDDSVLIISRSQLPRMATLEEWFRTMGFKMKIGDVVTECEQIKFCQTQPVFDGTRWVMCRDPRVVLQKDAHSIAPLSAEKTLRGWLGAVGQCGLSLAGNLPIYNEYYSWMTRNGIADHGIAGDPTMETGMLFLSKGVCARYSEPTVEARVSFWRAFGYDGTDQRLLEDHYRGLTLNATTHVSLPVGLHPESTRYRQTGACGSSLVR